MDVSMKIFRKILKRFRKEHNYPDKFDVWDDVVFNRGNIDFHDREQRFDYIKNCLNQIKDATMEIDNLNAEYNVVTSQLKDMEEIESLPAEDALLLKDAATKLININKTRSGYEQKPVPIEEAAYHKIDALHDQVEEGLFKLEEAEVYQVKIKQDMKHLAGEKEAYTYRKYDLQRLIEDLRAIMVVCLTAVALCIVLLLILQFGFAMNTQIGYLLAAGATAIAITLIFMKHNNGMRELKRVEKSINKIILLHNSVKIRYINNTNLLEYLHIKYGVRNSSELKKVYGLYLEEKKRREDFKQMEKDLDLAERGILRILRSMRLSDPMIWLHQPAAILDRKEMVEVRHNLIIRRQSLRKRMDYNREIVAKKAQDEIKDMVDMYPSYAAGILDLVADYEKRFK
ncbi:MAG: hypothetical protein FWE14_04825 [Lachnospiraceae bacterium]|nr:hypothetical protein [Lachnospiraceae bacterium]